MATVRLNIADRTKLPWLQANADTGTPPAVDAHPEPAPRREDQ
jgi:hypothetical protein